MHSSVNILKTTLNELYGILIISTNKTAIAPKKMQYLDIQCNKMRIGSVLRKLQNAYERNKDLNK